MRHFFYKSSCAPEFLLSIVSKLKFMNLERSYCFFFRFSNNNTNNATRIRILKRRKWYAILSRIIFRNMSLKSDKSSVVCVEAVIIGNVQIGERSVIHPKVRVHEVKSRPSRTTWLALTVWSNLVKAQIIAEKGPIVIGNDNLIEEGVIIKNSNEETLYVGNENIFEVQSQFEGDSFHMTHV